MRYQGVRHEMGITIERAYEIFYKYSAEFNLIQGRRHPPVPPDTQRRAMSRILAQLTQPQKKRLSELYVRIHDTSSLLDPTIARRLGLSINQQTRIQEMYDQAQVDFAGEIKRITQKVYREVGYTPPPPDYSMNLSKNAQVLPKFVQEALAREYPTIRRFREAQIGRIQKDIFGLLLSHQRQAFEKMKGRPPKVSIPSLLDVQPLSGRGFWLSQPTLR